MEKNKIKITCLKYKSSSNTLDMGFQLPFFIHQNVINHSLFLKGGWDVSELTINNFFLTLNNSQEVQLEETKKLTSHQMF
jgi:hypothetical protein